MSQQLISRSPDLLRLQEDGFEVAVVAGHLVIQNVPYVTPAGAVARGILLSTLALAGDRTPSPDTHVAMFAGEPPCAERGQPLQRLIHASRREALGGGLVVTHTSSTTPPL